MLALVNAARHITGKKMSESTKKMKKRPNRAQRGPQKPSKGSFSSADNRGKRSDSSKAKRPQKGAGRFAKRSQAPKTAFKPKGILLWGMHAVREAWLNPNRKCYRLWATEAGSRNFEEVLEQGDKKGLERPQTSKAERAALDNLLPKGAVHQGLVLDVAPLPETSLDDLFTRDKEPQLLIILDQVTDPHNVGAILRSAAAFGADGVIVTERNAPNETGILAKTACGAMEHVPLVPVVNLARALDLLKNENFWCVGLAEEGEKDLAASSLSSGKIALVLGAEGDGLRRLTRQHCDELVRLPTSGPIGSLNVSNAAVVSLYEVRRQKG